MKRVLVTGSSGYIGRHCLRPLADAGYEVVAPGSRDAGDPLAVDLLAPGRAEDLVDRVRPTHLLHLAWYTTPGLYWTSTENLRWVEASLALLRAFARSRGERAALAGSCAEYDWTAGHCSENATPLRPATLYGECKRSLSAIAQRFSQEAGFSLAWGRVFFPYGPGERPERLVPSVIRALLQGRPVPCTHGEQVRDFLHVQDAAEALVALLDSPASGPVNIASGVPVSLKTVVHTIADRLGGRELIRLGALPAPEHDPPLLSADTRRLREEVGWSPRFDLESGLEQTIEWWRAEER